MPCAACAEQINAMIAAMTAPRLHALGAGQPPVGNPGSMAKGMPNDMLRAGPHQAHGPCPARAAMPAPCHCTCGLPLGMSGRGIEMPAALQTAWA